MNGVKERAAYYMLFIAVLILVASVSYDAAMKTLEPRPYPPEDVEVSLFHSLQVVVEPKANMTPKRTTRYESVRRFHVSIA